MSLVEVLNQVWTVARHTILQALRMWIVLVVIAFLALMLLSMPFVLRADYTHSGQVKMVITYSVWLITFILSVLTLFLSAAVVWAEIKGRQILMIDPKPLSRGIFLLGKWVGVMLINVVLLVAMLGIAYGLVRGVVGRQWPSETDASYESFKATMFSARGVARAPLPDDLREKVLEHYNRMEAEGVLPENYSKEWILTEMLRQFSQRAWEVPPNQSKVWFVPGVPNDIPDGQWLMIRFKHYAADPSLHYEMPGRFIINEDSQPVFTVPEQGSPLPYVKWVAGKDAFFFVRAGVVTEEGEVQIRYINMDAFDENEKAVAALFPYQGGMEVHYPAAGLWQNFARVGLVILSQLAFLSIVGICASTFLSFPVAVLANITVLVVGVLRNMIFTSMLPALNIVGTGDVAPWREIPTFDVGVRRVFQFFFSAFPNLLPSDAINSLAAGQLVEMSGIFLDFVLGVWLLRGGVLAILAWVIFKRRQIALFTPNM